MFKQEQFPNPQEVGNTEYQFLGFRFTVIETGKVLMKVRKESVRRERKRLMHQASIFLPSEDIRVSAECWLQNASKGNNYFIIKKMEDFAMEIIKSQREMEKKLEASQAQVAKLTATLEYVAMMADIDISHSETTNTNEGGVTA